MRVKTVRTLGIFAFLMLVVFLGLGRWIDITQAPVKSDIVFCLGGGTYKRVDSAIELLNNGYVGSKKLSMLGESWYNLPFIRKHYPGVDTEVYAAPKNTRDEIRFIKTYMNKHHFKSALIVTDPPHSLRVKVLLSIIDRDLNGKMEFYIVGSGVKWWDREHYYRNETARKYAMIEVLKIPYNLYKIYINEFGK